MAESSENLDAITQTIHLITRLLTEADQSMAIVNHAPQAMRNERRQTRQGFKLPKMNIPVFSGEYLQWNFFWDLFNASVHSNETLTDVQRLQYLKASLKGDAAKIISHLTITDANYAGARNALQTRYANLRLIVRSHIRAVLEVPVMKGETAQEMRNLLETFREQMQALETFGVPIHQWDAILVCHISEKLDSESRKEWELAHAGSDLQTIQKITDFLSERCLALKSSSAKLKPCSPQKRKQSIAQIKAPMLGEGLDILNLDQNAVKPTVQVSQRPKFAKEITRCRIVKNLHLSMLLLESTW